MWHNMLFIRSMYVTQDECWHGGGDAAADSISLLDLRVIVRNPRPPPLCIRREHYSPRSGDLKTKGGR